MKPFVDIVFPPFDYSILIPEIGVPILTANLKKAGFSVEQADFNIEFINDYMATPSSYSPLTMMMEGIATREKMELGRDRDAFIQHAARNLLRLKGREEGQCALSFAAVTRGEIHTGKSCHLKDKGEGESWIDRMDSFASVSDRGSRNRMEFMEVLSQQERLCPDLRKDLLKVIQKFYFEPPSYRLEDVLK